MKLRLKATCSECLTMHEATITLGQENIKCPACGHAMRNLPEGELSEIETIMRRQRNYGIIALIAFAIASVAFFVWVFATKVVWETAPNFKPPEDESMFTVGYPTILAVALLVALVFSIMGSLKRFVIEF